MARGSLLSGETYQMIGILTPYQMIVFCASAESGARARRGLRAAAKRSVGRRDGGKLSRLRLETVRSRAHPRMPGIARATKPGCGFSTRR